MRLHPTASLTLVRCEYDLAAMIRFHPPDLYAALDVERTRRGLAWRTVAAETGVAASTIRRLASPGRCEVDGVIALTSWLGRRVEDFTRESSL